MASDAAILGFLSFQMIEETLIWLAKSTSQPEARIQFHTISSSLDVEGETESRAPLQRCDSDLALPSSPMETHLPEISISEFSSMKSKLSTFGLGTSGIGDYSY